MELRFEDLENHTGEVWEVWLCAYENEEPWFEDGCINQWTFDSEDEAREQFFEVSAELAPCLAGGYPREEGYDTLGAFLLRRFLEGGHRDGSYFTDDIVEMRAVPLA